MDFFPSARDFNHAIKTFGGKQSNGEIGEVKYKAMQSLFEFWINHDYQDFYKKEAKTLDGG